MKRRDFLKTSAMAALSGVAIAVPVLGSAMDSNLQTEQKEGVIQFRFRPDGKFKILQITDTHYVTGDPKSRRTMDNLVEMLDLEKPDLVIHTGDIIYGNPAAQGFRELFQPIVDRGIPFAVALGNHDSDFELSRAAAFEVIRGIKGNVNTPLKEGVHGYSNDVITLASDAKVERAFYLFDSGAYIDYRGEKGYDYVRHSQIDWYRKHSMALSEDNDGVPVPSVAFFHIPVREFVDGAAPADRDMVGAFGEPPCASLYNSGLVANFKELGDVEAIACGHDHDNDFVLKFGDIYYIYGRFGGCDTVYNNIGASGARVFEFTSGQKGFRTWTRIFGQGIAQELYLERDMKSLPE